MSRSQTKRPSDAEAGIPARKKRKLDAKARRRNAAASPGVVVQSDRLKWRRVALPDRLEDAEGFFGLEEIEGVDVVRDAEGRGVVFRTLEGKVMEDGEGEGEEEWGGFDDDENRRGDVDESVAGPSVTSTKGKIKTNDESQPTTHPASTAKAKHKSKPTPSGDEQIDLQLDGPFGVLADAPTTDTIDISAWRSLNLTDPVLAAISSLGFTSPTPIQSAAIPPILAGDDVVGKAVTGSGKTLAFGIPILEAVLSKSESSSRAHSTTAVGRREGKPTEKSPIALILAPTRELAHQLTTHLTSLGAGLAGTQAQPRIATVTGGLSILKQQRQLASADIVVGTPGRLWEVISTSTDGLVDKLKRIEFLVVDEADRLLSEGHFREVGQILDALDREVVEDEHGGKEEEVEGAEGIEATTTTTTKSESKQDPSQPHQRQTLVFSATFHKGLQQKLTGKLKSKAIPTNSNGGDLLSPTDSMAYLLQKLNFRSARPLFIDSNPTAQMSAQLHETIVECGAQEKDVYLYATALPHRGAKLLVFANSISSVKRLAPLLQMLDLPAAALHSGMPQKARLRSLERFTRAEASILVATDVAARGLDITGVDVVVHYHAPRTADTYVHRSGRTARAEKTGRSVLLCSPDEVAGVTRLVGKIHGGESGAAAPAVVQVDRALIARLQPRVALAKKINDASSAKEKEGSREGWLRAAAEELGVEYESEEFEAAGARMGRGRRGKDGSGSGRKAKGQGELSKGEIVGLKAQLRELLSKRVNLGVSERYLAGGRVDVDALLEEGKGDQVFLAGSRRP